MGDACAEKPRWLDETFAITNPVKRARVEVTEAEAAAAAAAAAAASPKNSAVAAATAAGAKEAAEETRRGVPRTARAHGAWTCGAALGSEGYVVAELKVMLYRT